MGVPEQHLEGEVTKIVWIRYPLQPIFALQRVHKQLLLFYLSAICKHELRREWHVTNWLTVGQKKSKRNIIPAHSQILETWHCSFDPSLRVRRPERRMRWSQPWERYFLHHPREHLGQVDFDHATQRHQECLACLTAEVLLAIDSVRKSVQLSK